jgi:hypothetical protein
MIATSDKFWQRFNGEVRFGTTYSKGNQSTQYSLGSETSYVRERWSARANFESNLSSSSGVNASTHNSLNTGALRLLPWNNWFYAGIVDFLQSSEQGISLQSSLGGGVGLYLKNTNRASISVLGGAAWQNTQYKQSVVPTNTPNVAAALFYADAEFFRFSKTHLILTASLLPALSDPGRVRLQYGRLLLRQDLQQLEMESFLLWELGQPAASHFFGQRLWSQLGAQLDVRSEMIGVRLFVFSRWNGEASSDLRRSPKSGARVTRDKRRQS